MRLEVIALADLLKKSNNNEKIVQTILNNFESIRPPHAEKSNDVEYFLKHNAIHFNKTGIASTHLIFSNYQATPILVGYFTLANKDLLIAKRNIQNFPKRLQKKIKQRAQLRESGEHYRLNAFLIGQLGKNYNPIALKTSNINGNYILNVAYQMMLEVQRIVGGSFIWIEYEDNHKLKRIYGAFGFSEIPNYTSSTNLKLAIKLLK